MKRFITAAALTLAIATPALAQAPGGADAWIRYDSNPNANAYHAGFGAGRVSDVYAVRAQAARPAVAPMHGYAMAAPFPMGLDGTTYATDPDPRIRNSLAQEPFHQAY